VLDERGGSSSACSRNGGVNALRLSEKIGVEGTNDDRDSL
jgi:hypothetical protein